MGLVDDCLTDDPIYQTIVGAGLLLLGKTSQVSVIDAPTLSSSGPLLIVSPFFWR